MSNLAEHEAEQAAITALCEAGECDHPECRYFTRTFVAKFTIEGERNDNDALMNDISEARSGMASWIESAIPDADDVTVWSSIKDFILDQEEPQIWTPENQWQDHFSHPYSDWRVAVENDETRQGYVDWVNTQLRNQAAMTDSLVTRSAPHWAWEIIDETLQMDSKSTSFEPELRDQITRAHNAMILACSRGDDEPISYDSPDLD